MTARILIVEDDADIARGLRFNLEHDGYAVSHAGTASAARAAFDAADERPDLVLLDLTLPDGDGLDLLRELRRRGNGVPVLCLTARAQETDVVMGLGLGADDYLRKPFGLAELLARVAALLRRSEPVVVKGGSKETAEPIRIGDASIDRDRHALVRGKHAEALTPIEMQLLDYLWKHRGRLVAREQLLKDLWGVDQQASTRTLDNHVARLRKKLEVDAANPRHLITVHGVGYRLETGTRS